MDVAYIFKWTRVSLTSVNKSKLLIKNVTGRIKFTNLCYVIKNGNKQTRFSRFMFIFNSS